MEDNIDTGKRNTRRKMLLVVGIIFFVLFLVFINFKLELIDMHDIRATITGLQAYDSNNKTEQVLEINKTYQQSTVDDLLISGEIKSIRINGRYSGEFRVWINASGEMLLLAENKKSHNQITGMDVLDTLLDNETTNGELIEQPSENVTETVTENLSENVSSSENPLLNENLTSNETLIVNDTLTIDETLSLEENLTIEENITVENVSSVEENFTIEENLTTLYSNETSIIEQYYTLNNDCVNTCSIFINITNASLVIELSSNSTLIIDSILFTASVKTNLTLNKMKYDITKFSGKTTKFNLEEDLTNVSTLILDKPSRGMIKWNKGKYNVVEADFDTCVDIGKGYAYVDSDNLDASIDSEAEITLEDIYYISPIIYRDNLWCSECDITSYVDGVLTFNVPGFSNYTVGSNTNLSIWDDTDTITKYINDTIIFYANYTNITSGESINGSGAYCNFSENSSGSWSTLVNMTFNSTSNLYEYNNSFATAGDYSFNISCYNTIGYDNLTVVDGFRVTTRSICGTLSTPNTVYTLQNNVTSTGTCFNITNQNITLDCNGYWITYSTLGAASTYGINTTQFHTTIKNCNILDGNWTGGANRYGIYFNGNNNSILLNNYVNVSNSYGIYLESSSNNNITNNNATSNTGIGGIYLQTSSNNTLRLNTGTSNTGSGIYLFLSSNNNITNNNATSNTSGGIFLSMSSSNILISNNGTSNTNYGIYLSTQSKNNILIGNTGASNTSGGIFLTLTSSNNTITNNTISSTTNTSLMISSNSGLNKIYWNNFTQTSGVYISNSNNTNTFNTTGGTGPQGNIYFNITSQEVNDTNSDGWGDTGTAYPISATTWAEKWTGSGSDYGPAITRTVVIICGTTFLANSVNTLTANVTSTGTCFNITVQNVTLDCNGYKINYSTAGGANTYGVYTNQFNTTIKNCNIYDGNRTSASAKRYGIYFKGNSNSTLINNYVNVSNSYGIYLATASNNTLISNNGASNSSYGICLNLSSNNNLTNNSGTSNASSGIYLSSSSNNNTITNNKGTSNLDAGIELSSSSNNILTSNNGTSNSGYGIYLSSSSNNILISNNGTSNANIGIFIYSSVNNNLTSNTGTSNSSVGLLSTLSSNNLTSNNGVSNSGVGIWLDMSSNNILTSNTGTSNTNVGIYLNTASDNILISNNGTSNTNVGIYIDSSLNNNLTSNTGTSNSSYGIYLGVTSNNNTITNNTVSSTTNTSLMIISTSGLNNIYWNNFTSGTYYINNSNNTNMFNTTVGGVPQGNIYFNITSQEVYDTDSDGWGDSGSAYPINSTNWGAKWTGYGSDYGPAITRTVASNPFSAVWDTSKTGGSNNTTIVLPLESSGTYNFTVDWGDGTNNTVTAYNGVGNNHSYNSSGVYTINITGTIIGFRFNGVGDRRKIININSWGPLRVGNSDSYFYGCSNLNSTATDNLDLTGTTNLYSMFDSASVFNGNISGWNTSEVTNMSGMFSTSAFNGNISGWNTGKVMDMSWMFDSSNFNQAIGSWNTSSVTAMQSMFEGATIFNKDISGWDVSKVTNMIDMFYNAYAFNQPIGNWDTSNVTSMSGMFSTSAFNSNIGGWNTGKVTDMSWMFESAVAFNQNISSWNTSSVTDMYSMFYNATIFNKDISGWDVSKVTDMATMFQSATSFNKNLSMWDTSKVTDMSFMFSDAWQFNGNISNWDTSKVTLMYDMFYLASAFNQPIGNWNTSKVTDMTGMFYLASNFNGNVSNWDTSKVTDMDSMFASSAFNQPLNNWNTSSVIDMDYMFFYASAFNQPIGNWNTSNVTTMYNMFRSATSFNQNISNWDTSKVTDMREMFRSATSFNQNIGAWNTSNVLYMVDMFNGVNLSTANYDALLIGWSTKPQIQHSFHGGGSKYSSAALTARNTTLIGVYNWTITDGGLSNYAPIILSSRISPVTPNASSALIGYCNASDADGNNVSYYYSWYRNGVLNVSNLTSNNYTQNLEINIANISGALTITGDNWTLSCKASDSISNSSAINSSVIITSVGLPSSTNFSGVSTNFSSIADTLNVSAFILNIPSYGFINWSGGGYNLENANFDVYVIIGQGFIYVNSSGLHSSINSSATLRLNNLSYANPVVYRDGLWCSACVRLSYLGGNLTFNVSGFSNYTVGSNTNLSIWDDTDSVTKYVNDIVIFYANYTNITSGVSINGTNVYCEFIENSSGSWSTAVNMTFNSTSNLYEYNNSLATAGDYSFNISCYNDVGYDNLTAVDGFIVNASIDIIPPSITFLSPTPDNTVTVNVSTQSIVANISDPEGSNTSSWIDFDKSLIGYWSMDSYNATGIYDNSTWNNFATFNGGINSSNLTTGARGQGLKFDGIDDYINVGDVNHSGTITVAAWLYRDALDSDTASWVGIVNKWTPNGADAADDWGMGIHKGNYTYWIKTTDNYTGVDTVIPVPKQEWIHIALTYNGTHMVGYVNGVNITTSALVGILNNGDTPLVIGTNNGSTFFRGLIDEAMVFNRALSSTEISALYNSQVNKLNATFTDLVEGQHNYTVYAVDEAGNMNTSGLRNFAVNTTIYDVVPPSITFESPTPDNGSTVNVSTQSIVANISDPEGANTSSWIDFDRSLVGYWSMDYYNATGIYDNSTYNNFGKFNGGLNSSNITTGIRGQGLTFDGVNDYLTVTTRTGLDIVNYTASVWINPNQGTDDAFFITNGDSGIWKGWDLAMDRNYGTCDIGDICVWVGNDTGVGSYVDYPYDFSVGNWTLWTVTYSTDTNNITMYINGDKVFTNTSPRIPIMNGTLYTTLGRANWDVGYFNGSMDEVLLFNRVLSATEIKALYNSQSNKFNATFTNLSNGQHNYTVYAKDVSGNINSSARTFTVDNSLQCGNLNTAGQTYVMTKNVTSNDTCFTINAANVTLDCNGYWITYSTAGGANTYGIYTNQFNTTIKNCNILAGNRTSAGANRYGIYFNTNDNSTLLNNYVNASNSAAIYLYNGANYNILTNNTGISTNSIGIFVYSSSLNNVLANNTGISNDDDGICLESSSSNNTLIGNRGISNVEQGIFVYDNSHFTTLRDNVGISTSSPGILVYSASNNILINNSGTCYNSMSGLAIDYSNNNIITNNTGISKDEYGILIYVSSNNNLTNNTGISNTSYGLYLQTSSNNILINNNGTSYGGGYGLIIGSSSNYNSLTGDTGTSDSLRGIIIWTSSFNNLTSCVGTSNSSRGIALYQDANNNILINSTGESKQGENGILIWLSANNILINSTGISNTSYGVRLNSARNNTLLGQTAIGRSAGSYGVNIYGSNDTVFRDCINITGINGDVYLDSISINNTVINCSYNTSKESVSAGSVLIRMWYFDANVTNTTGSPISSANLTIYNISSSNIYSELTNASGNINRTTITEYVNTGGTRAYSTPHTVNVTKTNYYTNSTSYNISTLQNVFTTIILQNGVAPITNNLILNSTFGLNKTDENLTVYYNTTDGNGDATTTIADWRLNGISIAVLNMPFDTNVSTNATDAVRDYSTYENNGTLGGGVSSYMPIWNATCKVGGCYKFDGVNDIIKLKLTPSQNISTNISFGAWANKQGSGSDSGTNYIINKGYQGSTPYQTYGIVNYNGTSVLGCTITIDSTRYYLYSNESRNESSGWFNVFCTYDGIVLKMYIDGVLSNSTNISGNINNSLSNNQIKIGAWTDSGTRRAFNGFVDEVYVLNHTLSPQQIKAIYDAGVAGHSITTFVSNETEVGDNWTVALTPNDAVQDGTTSMSNDLIISSPDVVPPSITFESPTPDNGSTVNVSTQSIVANISDPEGANTSSWIDFDRSLVGYWSMDYYNSTGIFDNSTYNNFATFNGGINSSNLTTGIRGQGLKFDGIDDILIIADDTELNLTTFTISGWFYDYGVGGRQALISRGYGTSAWNTAIMYIESNGEFRFYGDDVSGHKYFYSGFYMPQNQWVHLTVVYNSTHVNLYVNGTMIYNASQTNNFNFTSGNDWTIGLDDDGSSYAYPFNGTIDEVLIFNRGLSSTEVSALYNSRVNKFNASFTGLADGQHNYTVYAVDEAGNINSSARTFTVDNSLQCGNLNTAGQTYVMTKNVTSNDTCFTINAANVTLDCNGYWINYSTTGVASTRGVYTTQFNTTVKNCNILDGNWTSAELYRYGIFLYGADNSTLLNNFVNVSNGNAIILDTTNFNNLTNNTGVSNSTYGIVLRNSWNNNIYNITGISNTLDALYLNNVSYSIISNAVGVTNSTDGWSAGIQLASSNNNIINNSRGTSTTGIGIYFGSSFNNTLINSVGNGTSTGYVNNIGIFVRFSNYNRIINSTGQGVGTTGLRLDTSLFNNISDTMAVSNSADGFSLQNSSYNIITNITATSNTGRGMWFIRYWDGNGSSFNNTVINSTIQSQSSNAISLDINSTNNTFIGNKLISGDGAHTLIYLVATASNNKFYWNNFTNTSSYYVEDLNGSNIYNTTINGIAEGNVWFNVLNGSVNITGRILSGYGGGLYIGSAGSKYPYNSSNSVSKLSGIVVDYAPLTNVQTPSMCGVLSTPNVIVTLIDNETSTGTCFTVSAQNVTINCNGYWITYSTAGAASTYGIFTNQFNTTIKNCNIIHGDWSGSGSDRRGIYLSGSTNSSLLNNYVSTRISEAIILSGGANFNTLVNNTAYCNSSNDAIWITSSSSYNTLINNIAVSGYHGLCVMAPNNLFINNTAISPNIPVNLAAGSNTFIGQTALSGYAIDVSSGVSNVLIRDCVNITGGTYDVYIGGSNTNITFINCSYDIGKEWVNASGGYMSRLWYFDANVTNTTGSSISSANLTIYNISSSNIYSELTNASGDINRTELVEYVNNGGTRTYATPHTANVTKGGYYTNSTNYNISTLQNVFTTIILQNGVAPITNNLIFNSTFGLNTTDENLTVYYNTTDGNGDSTTTITDWRLNDTSIAVLNMPFDTSVSSTTSGAIRDYSIHMNNGTLGGGDSDYVPVWNVAGKIGGAYTFDGINDYISIADNDSFSFGNGTVDNPMTVMAWINMNDADEFKILSKGVFSSTIEYYFRTGDQGGNTNQLMFRVYDASQSAAIGRRYSTALAAYEGQWIYVVATYNGSGTAAGIKLFLNGVRVDDTDNNYGSGYVAMENLNANVNIGRYAAGYYANGSIDQVYIFNRELSPEQINASYQAGLNNKSIETIVSQEIKLGNNWTVALTPNDAVQDGTTSMSNDLIISSPDTIPPSITFESPTPDNGSTVNVSTQSIVANISDPEGANTSSWIDFDRSLVGYWSMDYYNSTGIYDNSTWNNFGTFNGGINSSNLTTGVRGQGLKFDGVNDYVNVNYNNNLNNLSSYTVSAWIKPGVGSNKIWLSNGEYLENGWYIYAGDSNGVAEIAFNNATNYVSYYSEPNFYELNNWVYFTAVFNKSKLTFYKNGVQSGSTQTITVDWLPSSYNLVIGKHRSGASNNFNGSLDEVLIFNRSLSQSEISALYNSQSNKFNTTFTNLANGQHNYTLYAVDEAGNFNSSGIRNFNVDTRTVLSDCANISSFGDYVLNQNVSSNGTCFNILTDNVTIDCAGYTIRYANVSVGNAINNSGGYDNLTVENCNILKTGSFAFTNSATAISISYGASNYAYNNTIRNTIINMPIIRGGEYSYSITAYLARNLTIDNVTANMTGDNNWGSNALSISYCQDVIINNSILMSTMSDNDAVIALDYSERVIMHNTNITSLHSGPLKISGEAVHNIDTSNRNDGYPILYNYSLNNIVVLENTNLTNVYGQVICHSCNNVTYSNLTLGSDGLYITETSNSKFENLWINSVNGSPLSLWNSDNNIFTNLSMIVTTSNAYGIVTDYSDSNNFTGIDLSGASYRAINSFGTSDPNRYVNYTFTNPQAGITLGGSNEIFDNGIVNSSNYDYGFYTGWDDLNNITISNTYIIASGTHIGIGTNNTNISLTNVTFNKAPELNISSNSSKIFIYEYIDVNVTNSVNVMLSGASVNSTDVFGTSRNNSISSGNSLTRLVIFTQLRNQTTNISYNNYTINASKVGYITNWTNINVTNSSKYTGSNHIKLVLLSADTTPPTITFEEPPTPTNASTVNSSTQTIVANISDASNTSSWIDFDRSLVGYWAMDYYNSTGIYDNSTYNNFGKFNGGLNSSNLTTGARGQGLKFDGIDDYIASPISTFSINNTGTFALWVKPFGGFHSGDASPQGVMLKNNVGNNSGDVSCGFHNLTGVFSCGGGSINSGNFGSATDSSTVASTTTSWNEQWYFITLSWNNTEKFLYVNGVLEKSISNNENWFSNLSQLELGRGTTGGIGNFFNGSLDEVLIFNRSLSQSEILALYNSQSNKFNTTFTGLSEGQHNYTLYAVDEAGNLNQSSQNFIYDAAESASNITSVVSVGSIDPIESSQRIIKFNFTVNDAEGNNTINVSSAVIRVNNSGISRQSTAGSCIGTPVNTTAQNITCNVSLQYYDPAGIWNINISIEDTMSNYTTNTSTTFTYNNLYAVSLNTNLLDFGALNAGDVNKTAGMLQLNNTGNFNYTLIQLKAYDLANDTYILTASNFRINITNVSVGNILSNNTFINITGARLSRSTDTTIGNQSMYVYLDIPLGTAAKKYSSLMDWILSVS